MKRGLEASKKKRGDQIKLIVQANQLVDARYMFTVWEARFFYTLVAMIHKDDEEDKEYRVWLKDIKKNFPVKSNQSYDLLRQAARSLNRTPVYIGWDKDELRRGREYTLFEFVDYLEAGQKGSKAQQQEYIDLRIHKKMRPFLLHVKKNFDKAVTRYTSFELSNVEKLKPYAMRFYELFKQHEFKGYREFHIQTLKERFLIEDEYPAFGTFNQRVIMPSIKAINKHTDLFIPIDKIEKIKQGRSVVAIRCIIQRKSNVSDQQKITPSSNEPEMTEQYATFEDVIPEQTEADRLFEQFEEVVVKSFGVTPSAFLKLLSKNKYKAEEIKQAISVTRRAKFNQEIRKNIAGFFVKALKDGYTDPKEEQKKRQKEAAQLKTQLEKLEDEQYSAINERIREITSADEQVTQQAIEAILASTMTAALVKMREKALKRPLITEDYRKDEQLRGMVITNIVSQQKDKFEDVLATYVPKIEQLKAALDKLK